MIFICNIIIYPLIKKKIKFNHVCSCHIVIVSKNLKKLTNNDVSLSKRKKKNLHNILGVSVLGPVGTRPD